MSNRGAVWLIRCRWVWVCIDDLVATLFTVTDNTGDAAENSFTLLVCSLFAITIEDFGVGRKTAGWLVC